VELLNMLSPVGHTSTPQGVEKYLVEPYVVSADVYRLEGRIGMGGWTWYTGSAAWMYRAWIEEVLGLRRRGDRLIIDPVIPPDWESFSVKYRYGEAMYEIAVRNPDAVGSGVEWIEIDGRRQEGRSIPLEDRFVKHHVTVRLGAGGS
jgi:cyclic beta-1,2-glucan synthetase